MKHHAVTHRHVIAKNKGILVLHHVQDAAVLDIGVFSNADVVNIAANNGVKPHTGVISDLHIANNLRPVGDERGRHLPLLWPRAGGAHAAILEYARRGQSATVQVHCADSRRRMADGHTAC